METGTEARRGIGPAWVAVALGVVVALALAVTSRSEGVPGQPLELQTFQAIGSRDSAIAVQVGVRNTGEVDLEVLDAWIPDLDDVHFGSGTNAPTSTVRARADGTFALRIPTLCPNPPALDRVNVRVRINGHVHAQSLRFPGAVRWKCR
ncbi:hypothetical protein OJ997_02980 [Solirubrobacter phytolaccae]|uniref:Uncharacterized protein n=1 Tax=Solirubrobacter phytolaccae TaxID=1404360 RepID=A0A9X3N3Y9_9ACTN|nr:hypothetical protein [Solirubrobacter phytolaccae]MDA0179248.1 hypothetical protein [Solirubrobacter phytolaccae]